MRRAAPGEIGSLSLLQLFDPDIPIPHGRLGFAVEALQAELRSLQARMEALEPVNMLALQELEELEKVVAEAVEEVK